jgi:hypothetical protein
MTNFYITYHKVLDFIESFQEQSPIMNSFGYGNLVDFGRTVSGDTQNATVEYPFLFAVPINISYNENTTEYQMSLIFADILNTDLMNEKEVISDMSLQARRFISYIKRGIRTFPELYENFDLELPIQAIPFMERFGDHVAGVAIDVNLIVFEDINACDYYVEPTPTPTATTTATPTPTITPTNTATPTITPSATPNRCVEYSGTSFGVCCLPISYVDCNGTLITNFYNYFDGTTFCGRAGSLQNPYSGTGQNLIIEVGNCIPPSPTPTKTATPTLTPTSTQTLFSALVYTGSQTTVCSSIVQQTLYSAQPIPTIGQRVWTDPSLTNEFFGFLVLTQTPGTTKYYTSGFFPPYSLQPLGTC